MPSFVLSSGTGLELATQANNFSLDVRNVITSAFTCKNYSPKPGSKRCVHYLPQGACARPDELMCIEWLKANNQSMPKASPEKKNRNEVDRDLFGNPLPQPRPKPAKKSPPAMEKPQLPKSPPVDDVPIVRNLSDEEIASFKALGVEVCIQSEDVGEIWLVGDYSERNRKEISVEHAATLSALCSTFPGAKIASFEKIKDPANNFSQKK